MKWLLTLAMALLMAINANSQKRIEVEAGDKKMSKGDQLAFTVVIPDSKENQVKPLWNKYVNNRTAGEKMDNFNTQIGNIFKSKEKRTKRDRLKMDSDGNELYVRSVKITEADSLPMDVYAIINQVPEGSQLSAFFQYTDSVFIDESNVDEQKLTFLKEYVRNFGVKAYKEIFDDSIKMATKEVSREEGRLKDIQASTNREEKSIVRNEEAILNFRSKIGELQNDSARIIQSIESKDKEISEINNDSPEYNGKLKELKNLEKMQQRYNREIISLKKRIKDKESDIESAKDQIAANELQLESQKVIVQNKQQVAQELIKEKEEIE